MPSDSITLDDLRGLFAVPPLPRHRDRHRTFDFDAAERVAAHIAAGGVSRFLYGGNAFLYHVTLDEFEAFLGWLAGFPDTRWPIPSVGPSFGRAIDQCRLLRRHHFRTVMVLPCGDPRDPSGMEAGMREIADAAGVPLILYVKSEDAFGSDKDRGHDAIGRLVADEVAIAVRYAVVRSDPGQDPYLEGLLRRVDRRRIISGIGERPAVVHLRDFQLGGMTTGSGCIAPRQSNALLTACLGADWDRANRLRDDFIPLEDLRDAWGPARVLHHATELAGIACTGPIPPYVSSLDASQIEQLAPVARALREQEQ